MSITRLPLKGISTTSRIDHFWGWHYDAPRPKLCARGLNLRNECLRHQPHRFWTITFREPARIFYYTESQEHQKYYYDHAYWDVKPCSEVGKRGYEVLNDPLSSNFTSWSWRLQQVKLLQRIDCSFYSILSIVSFKVFPSTDDTTFPTFLPLLECFLELNFCDGEQFSYRIFLNLL